MRQYVFILTLFFFAQLSAQQIVVDESKATIKFVFVDEDVDGSLSDFDFTGAIDLDDLDNSIISGTVATETLDTDNWLRNKILRGNKYFDARDHPQLKFKSTSIRSGGGREFVVYGDLTMKGITKQVSFTFTNSGNKLHGGGVINAAHWDIKVYKERERNMVNVMITLPYSTL